MAGRPAAFSPYHGEFTFNCQLHGIASIEISDSDIRGVLVKTDITVTEADVAVNAPKTVSAGAPFQVQWHGPNVEGDSITVGTHDDPHNHIDHAYTRDGSPAKLRAPAQPGTYQVRYSTKEGGKILVKTDITVTEADVAVNAPKTVPAGAPFQVQWHGPNVEGDIITVATPDESGGYHIHSAPTRKGSPTQLKAPDEPGIYEVRYIMDMGRKILGRTTVRVN